MKAEGLERPFGWGGCRGQRLGQRWPLDDDGYRYPPAAGGWPHRRRASLYRAPPVSPVSISRVRHCIYAFDLRSSGSQPDSSRPRNQCVVVFSTAEPRGAVRLHRGRPPDGYIALVEPRSQLVL